MGLEGFAPFRPLLGPAAVPPVWWFTGLPANQAGFTLSAPKIRLPRLKI